MHPLKFFCTGTVIFSSFLQQKFSMKKSNNSNNVGLLLFLSVLFPSGAMTRAFMFPSFISNLTIVRAARIIPSTWQSPFAGRRRHSRRPRPQPHYTEPSSSLTMMMSTNSNLQLRTLAEGSHVSELEIKKSRFLGYAKSVNSWKEAQTYLGQIKSEHPKARHWCFGYYTASSASAASGPGEGRCSDDGEPTGTAGVPILGAIKGEGISNAICVVVRYFGGIKLGAGGLLRAYGAAARQVLRVAPTVVLIPTSAWRITVPSSTMAGAVYEAIHRLNATAASTTITDEQYEADGSFCLTVVCATDQVERLRSMLQDATRGNAIVLPLDSSSYDDSS